MSDLYQYGETVDITIRGAKVASFDERGLWLDLVDGDPGTRLPLVDGKVVPGVEVTLVEPVDGAPQVGDLWTDQHGTNYVAFLQPRNHGPNEVLLHNGQSSYTMAQLCEHRRFRMSLIYRKPAPAPAADPLAVASQQLRESTTGDEFTAGVGALMDASRIGGQHDRGDHDDCAPAWCAGAEARVAELHGETAPAVKA